MIGQKGETAGTLQATVTRLEMTHPPSAYPPAPMGEPLAVMRCRSMPLHYYRYLYDRVGRKWHWTGAFHLSDAELEAQLKDEKTDIRVLYLDGAPAGYFEICRLRPEETALVHFGLMEHAIGRGLSRWFLGEAIRAGWETGPQKLSVETCTLDHPAALGLYQKMGFEPVLRREDSVRKLSPADRKNALYR
ncbi:GNAT family N-acetyltransferase [Nitratireductor luteus]|uniref:GNAT family N-acetyltransferase n=1 Tax=Nitratireductor luteus TaxID=2976980 RepID=UPI00223ED8BE|nr:GNAT family N-acetyltransferase [Nitratireductor luteus]